MNTNEIIAGLKKDFFPNANKLAITFDKDFTERDNNTTVTVEVYSNNGLETFAHSDLNGVLDLIRKRTNV